MKSDDKLTEGNTRTLFFGFGSPLFLLVAQNLRDSHGITPAYWSANADMMAPVKARFPEAVFHDRFDAVRGIPPKELKLLKPSPLDRSLLTRLAYLETTALQMMERMDAGSTFSYSHRVALYHQHVSFWLAALQRLEPDLLLFFSTPHFVYDYVAYRLAELAGIRTVLLRHSSLPGLSLTVNSVERGHEAVEAVYRSILSENNREHVPLRNENEAYLARLQRPYLEAEPAYMKRQRQKGYGSTSTTLRQHTLPRIAGHIGRAWQATTGLLRGKKARTVLVGRGKPVTMYPSTLDYAMLKGSARLRQRGLLSEYRRHAFPPDLKRPYVFLALHFQPERTTSPDAGVFTHQRLIVSQLVRHLPAGWMLYVKEHPTQYVSEGLFDSLSSQQRSKCFYEDLVSHHNVQLLPLDSDPFALIAHAQAVATATGTVGWEAIVRGRPVLAFGYPWYLGCESVFHVMDDDTLAAAMQEVIAGHTVNPDNTRLFVRALEVYGFVRPPLGTLHTKLGECDSALARQWSHGIADAL